MNKQVFIEKLELLKEPTFTYPTRARYGVWPSVANNAVVMSEAELRPSFGLKLVTLVCSASERCRLGPLWRCGQDLHKRC